jgi:hypothetical protein
MAFSNSPLVSYTRLSPNNSGQRKNNIDRITPHCVVGQISVESLGNVFANTSRKASCNYGIGVDGRVGLYCCEKNISWCSSSAENDNRAVTIECASDPTHPYAFNNTVYNKLIDLCVDICKRNGKNKLIWFGDKQKTLSYRPQPNEMVITVHRWFKNKACPGDWLMSKMTDMVNKVNAKLGSSVSVQPVKETITSKFPYLVSINTESLNIRKERSASSPVTGVVRKGSKYTIVDERQNGSTLWGKLKSGAGWISLKFTIKA